MSRPDLTPTLSPAHLYRTLIPLGVLAAAAAVGASRDEGSVLPPTTRSAESPAEPSADPAGLPAAPGPAPRSARAAVEVLSLRAGPEPTPWAVPGRVAASFVTNSPTELEVMAVARVPGRPTLEQEVEWTIQPPAGFEVPGDATLRGARLYVRLKRPGGNPSGAGDPLSLSVTARVKDGESTLEAGRTLTQDLRDRLRQEYVDLTRRYVPTRAELLDEVQFRRRYAKKYPAVQFSELNFSRRPGTQDRYPYVMVSERLIATLQKTEKLFGRPLIFGSGFRNPTWQVVVHGSVEESHHQYGRAADLHVPPDCAAPKTGRDIAWPADWLKLAAASLRGGGVWIEPMTDCHPWTNGCHVHVDVRERGNRSQIVQVTGVVTDPSGNPVPGATVRLAGMPAVTNERGVYTLKHVMYEAEGELEVEAAGRPVVTQAIRLDRPVLLASVAIPADPHPTLIARTELASRGANGVNLRVRLKNVGGSEARGLRLSAAAAAAGAAQVEPAQVTALGPGQEHVVEVQVPMPKRPGGAEATELPLKLTASFRTPAGSSRTQNLPVRAALAAEAPAAAEAAARPEAVERVPAPQGGGPVLPAAAGGLATGAAAAGVAAAARRRAARAGKKPESEPSLLPTTREEPASPAPASEPPAAPAEPRG